MAFFCAGSSSKTIGKQKGKGSNSKPQPMPKDLNNMNGRVAFNPPSPPGPPLPTIPHSDTVDLPHKRKMIVVQEYVPQDAKGLPIHRGDSVLVMSQEGEWLYVRNERGKEGFVPTSHLLAPYSATRTRLGSRSTAIRHVASGDSVSSFEPSPKSVPMYASHSAGRPRGKSAERDKENRDNRVNGMRKAVSPPTTTLAITHNDISNNNSNPNMLTTSYEQKHSPSSSSGVASMNDPSSPSFSSLHQSSSQENVGHRTSSSSLNHSQHDHSTTSSHSSIENETPRLNGVDHFDIPTMKTGPVVSDEMLSRNGKATSESNITSRKPRLLPPRHDRMQGVTRMRRTEHIYSEIEIGDDVPPPPIPPRNLPLIEEPYANPIDACSQEPVFNYPRAQSVTDVSDKTKHVKSNGVYSSVFQNGTATMTKPSHRRMADTTPETIPSDGNSVPSRRSSKKNSSRNHLHEDCYLEGPHEKLPRLLLNGMENRPTLHPQTKICKFRKCLWGLFIVLEDFEGWDEDEVTVKKGEHVSVWNQDDRDWYWIVKHASNDSEEGFVPSSVLREIVSTDSKCIPGYEAVVHQNGVPTSSAASPKQFSTDHPETRHRSGSQEQRHRSGSQEGRHRSGSQEARYRSGSQEGRRRLGSQDGRSGMRVRPGSGGYRGRRGSDSSSSRSGSHLVRTPSSSSIEKVEIPDTPPSSPPPPYSVHDNVRNFSLSQQQESSLGTYGTHMHRTRSQGYVAPRTYLPRVRANAQEQRGRERQLGNGVNPPVIDSGTLV